MKLINSNLFEICVILFSNYIHLTHLKLKK